MYFEANGHGTVLFSPNYYVFLQKCISIFKSPASFVTVQQKSALRRLQLIPALINQAVGDAYSDLLLVEAILHIKRREGAQLSGTEHYSNDFGVWDKLYQELPSRQLKVQVQDRTRIKTNSNETKTISPPDLQPALDSAINSMNKVNACEVARVFVRPSGTEDTVRIYAEAQTVNEANSLANEAKIIVQQICSDRPVSTYSSPSRL